MDLELALLSTLYLGEYAGMLLSAAWKGIPIADCSMYTVSIESLREHHLQTIQHISSGTYHIHSQNMLRDFCHINTALSFFLLEYSMLGAI